MSQLDMEQVGRIARNEARRLSGQMWDFLDFPVISGPLSERYVELYLEMPDERVAPIAGRALEEADEAWNDLVEGGASRWPDEFVVGHALAVAARDHACADTSWAVEAFAERAAEPGDHSLLDRMGVVDAARLEGVDMDRAFRSAQTCTPRDVAERAAEHEVEGYASALDLLGPRDFERIAEGLMESFGGLELDYQDYEDIDCRIADVVEEKLARRQTVSAKR